MSLNSVLIVDDDELLLKGLCRALKNRPFHVFTATSADEAMGRIALQSFDVVVTDFHMKGVNGSEFVEWLKKYHPSTARIIMTGNSVHRLGITNEAYALIEKPVSIENLCGVINDAFESRDSVITSHHAPTAWNSGNRFPQP